MKSFPSFRRGLRSGAALAGILLAGCGDAAAIRPGDIRTYSVAKAPAAPARPPAGEGARPATVRYEVPPGWQDLGGSGMRLTTLAIGDASAGHEVSLSRARGTMRDTVIRWQRQLVGEADDKAVAAAADRALAAAGTVNVDGVPAQVVVLDAAGFPEAASAAGQVIMAAVVPSGDDSLFVKFRGSADVAAREKDNFIRFVASLRPN
jgi:hypothetical protein